MEDIQERYEEGQRDLFSSTEPETRSERLKSFFRFQREPAFVLKLETLTLTLVGAVLLLIFSFYVGFTRGKAVERQEISHKIQALKDKVGLSNEVKVLDRRQVVGQLR